jgi:hypothetical protein
MTAAAAEIPGERFTNVAFGRMRPARQERSCRHDHAVRAISALGCLLRYERRLHLAGPSRIAQAFERRDILVVRVDGEGHAGARRLAVDQDAAGAALAETASELGTPEPKIISQSVKQRHVRVVDADRVILPIHSKSYLGHDCASSNLPPHPITLTRFSLPRQVVRDSRLWGFFHKFKIERKSSAQTSGKTGKIAVTDRAEARTGALLVVEPKLDQLIDRHSLGS